MKGTRNAEEALISELESVRGEERELRQRLDALVAELAPAKEGDDDTPALYRRYTRLQKHLLPPVRERRLELEAELTAHKARTLRREATPSRERYRRAREALQKTRKEYEEARREWLPHEKSIRRASWQADRLRGRVGALTDGTGDV